MKLKSFGCSFIFGTDLPRYGLSKEMTSPNKNTFPGLIAKRLDMEYVSYSRPGAGNFEILNRVLSEIGKNEPALFMINWTWIDRFSYINETEKPPLMFDSVYWNSILPIDDSEVSKLYYKHLHNQLRDKMETLICIKTAIDCLRGQKQRFVMTWTDDLIWEDQWHCTDSVKWLQDQVGPWVKDFEGLNFINWSRKNGFEISKNLHPLEDAHKAAADLILAHWDDYVKS